MFVGFSLSTAIHNPNPPGRPDIAEERNSLVLAGSGGGIHEKLSAEELITVGDGKPVLNLAVHQVQAYIVGSVLPGIEAMHG